MRLILIGSEYAGKATLAVAISKWMIRTMGLPFVRWHNHFVVPKLDQHLIVEAAGGGGALPGKGEEDVNSEEDEEQIMGLRPSVLEQLQRHNIWRHLHPDMYVTEEDNLVIDFYYADAVYAPLYYGYGAPGTFADRRQRARAWDHQLMKLAPDTVLALITASPEVIRQRMRREPRPRGILKERDVETVLDGFKQEYDDSLIHRRFVVDMTTASSAESLKLFLEQMWPYLSQWDRLRMTTRPEEFHNT